MKLFSLVGQYGSKNKKIVSIIDRHWRDAFQNFGGRQKPGCPEIEQAPPPSRTLEGMSMVRSSRSASPGSAHARASPHRERCDTPYRLQAWTEATADRMAAHFLAFPDDETVRMG
jgi:hypothetical protein